MSVLVWALEPVAILLLAALVLREHIPAALAASVDAAGITLTVISIGFCALYAVLTRRLLLDDSSLRVVLAQQATALLFAVGLATVVEVAGGTGCGLGGLDAEDWLSAAASGVVYYGLGFWFFVTGLRLVPASVAGSFLPLIPVFGLAAGHLVGERLEPRQWLGAAIILAATAAIARQQQQPATVASLP